MMINEWEMKDANESGVGEARKFLFGGRRIVKWQSASCRPRMTTDYKCSKRGEGSTWPIHSRVDANSLTGDL